MFAVVSFFLSFFEEKMEKKLKGFSKTIVDRILEYPGTTIGLGSGLAIEFLVLEIFRQKKMLQKKNIRFVVFKQKMRKAFKKEKIRAFFPENSMVIPELDCYLDEINVVCNIDGLENPMFIKSSAASDFPRAMMKKAKTVCFIGYGMELYKTGFSGIPIELEHNSAGFEIFKTWQDKYGGTMGLRSNINGKENRIYMEWVPPMDWRFRSEGQPDKNEQDLIDEINKTPGVVSHNLFGEPKCHFVENGEMFKMCYQGPARGFDGMVFV
ncbi:hypothetical protein B9Z55_024698 [Caenorhabditis nigoni]|nr:hypothetical protein B9Z55_024698 [Caenorhabditis nigoni]